MDGSYGVRRPNIAGRSAPRESIEVRTIAFFAPEEMAELGWSTERKARPVVYCAMDPKEYKPFLPRLGIFN
jgi:hypothetical protein